MASMQLPSPRRQGGDLLDFELNAQAISPLNASPGYSGNGYFSLGAA